MRLSNLILASAIVFALFLPASFALSSIEVVSPQSGAVYNVGSDVAITGQITIDKNIAGAIVTFSATSKRLNKTLPIATKIYSFQPNTPTSFSLINKGTLSWTIPFETVQSDDWQIYVSVDKEPEKIVEHLSTKFTISKSLSLSVSSNTKLVNLGETIESSGTVLDSVGKPIEGSAEITLQHAELGPVFTDTYTITNGFIDFRRTMERSDPAGNYSIIVKVSDNKGSTALRVVSGIIVSNALSVNCTIPKPNFEPGDEFSVIGNVRNIHGKPVDNADMVSYLSFPDQPLSISFDSNSDRNGNYAVQIELPKLAGPGTYSISTVAEDLNGNSGSCFSSFSINAQQAVLIDVQPNSTWYYRTTEAGIDFNIKNKGNVDLSGKASILVDNKEVKSFDFSVRKGEDRTFSQSWDVNLPAGAHTLSILMLSADNKILTQTAPQSFTVYDHPGHPDKFKLGAKWAFIIIGVAFAAAFLYIKRKEIRDYLWHWQLKREYGIGRQLLLNN